MDIEATNVFKRNYQSKGRYVINRGGTRSSKTYSLAQLCVLRLYTGVIQDKSNPDDKGVLSIVRKHSTTLRATAMRDIEAVIDSREIRDQIDINKTEKTYKFKGRTLECFGADNQQKLRGGGRDYLYCNEGNELNRDKEFFQLMIRTKKKIFIDFNPDNEDIRINQELEIKRKQDVGDVDVIISTYKDNPFLPEMQVKEIERLEKIKPQYWKIYGLGEYGRLEGVIFQNWTVIDGVPADAQLLGYGKDFGFTNDPTTLTAIYRYNGAIVLHELIYETGMTNQDIVRRYKTLGISNHDEIVADSAEPKSIEEIRSSGYNIKPAEKGPDSIKFGIDLMLQYEIQITATSRNAIREFKGYTWALDKDGKLTNKPIDELNHCIDGVRYFFQNKLKIQPSFTLFIGG